MTTTPEANATTRPVPCDIDAEAAVLGSMYLAPERIGDVAELLTAGSFLRPAHALLFELFKSMAGQGQPFDFVTVFAEAKAQGLLTRIGNGSEEDGKRYIIDVAADCPSPVNLDFYTGIVRDKADKRELILLADQLRADAFDDQRPSVELRDQYGGELVKMQLGDTETSCQTLAEIGEQRHAEIEAAARGEGDPRELSTGFPALDRPTRGLRPGDLYVIGAAQNTGKTSLALNITAAIARTGKPALFVSSEMGRDALWDRLLAAEAAIPITILERGRFKAEQLQRYTQARTELASWPVVIDDRPRTVGEIIARMRQVSLRFSEPVKLVVVDYLQLMRIDQRKGESRARAVGQYAAELKQLARQSGAAVLLLSQFNREGAKAVKPSIFDLRDSGEIENHADTAVLLHDPEETETNGWDIIDARVAKARNGFRTPWPDRDKTVLGEITFRFKGELAKFESKSLPPEGENHV